MVTTSITQCPGVLAKCHLHRNSMQLCCILHSKYTAYIFDIKYAAVSTIRVLELKAWKRDTRTPWKPPWRNAAYILTKCYLGRTLLLFTLSVSSINRCSKHGPNKKWWPTNRGTQLKALDLLTSSHDQPTFPCPHCRGWFRTRIGVLATFRFHFTTGGWQIWLSTAKTDS